MFLRVRCSERFALTSELIGDAGWMFPVLDLDPVIAPAAAVGALAVLGDQALQPHQAGVAKQVRPDLALFKWRQVDAIQAPR